MSERYEHVERAIREHVAAFNAQDLQRLLTGLAPDVVWQTGEDTFRGHEELTALFGGAFRTIAPKLTIHSLLIDHDRAACELQEGMTVDGIARAELIAGFYRVDTGQSSSPDSTVSIHRASSPPSKSTGKAPLMSEPRSNHAGK